MSFLRDLRYGFRILLRYPTYAVAAIGVVSLGVGATTAVFSVVRGVLLQRLPYREPDRLVLFRADLPGYARRPLLTGEELVALRDRSDLFESVAVIGDSEGNLTTPGDMAAVTAASASDNFLETLGVSPLLGRSVSRIDTGTQWVSAVDISYELWVQHWQKDPNVVGKRIEINNIPMTVAGVLPRGFRLYLGPGQAAVDTMATAIVAAHPSNYPSGSLRISLSTIDQDVVSDAKPALFALAGAVAFVLLVACANLTNLLLARASARTREIAVRASIGASRRRIIEQLLAEGLVVGGLGACAGLLLAQWAVDGLLQLAPPTLPRREAIAIDAGVAAFAVVLSLLSSLLVSLVPAWHATKADVASRLKQDPAASRATGITRGLLVASQLALSLILLAGAGLMARAFINMRTVPLGFDSRDALTMNVHLKVQQFNTGEEGEARARRLAFYRELTSAVRELPGVQQVGFGLPVPFSDRTLVQRLSTGPTGAERATEALVALSGYLETLRVPLTAGRYFSRNDDDRPAVILEQRLADDLFPQQPAVGRRVLLAPASSRPQWADVVGVVPHLQTRGLRSPGLPQIWMSYAAKSYSDLDLVVRGSRPMGLASAVERIVQRMGPGRPVHDVRLLEDYVADASADTRFSLYVLGGFAVLAVILAAIGVYGVVAYATARRMREIAVRLALGADGRTIVALVVRDGLGWTIAGIVVGVAGAFGLTRYLSSLLFGVGQHDPLTLASVALFLGAIAVTATALPAIRAVRVDPMLALRSE